MDDTADEVGSLEQCLYSLEKRVQIARFLLENDQKDLMPTILEDIFTSCQMILDTYCVVGYGD